LAKKEKITASNVRNSSKLSALTAYDFQMAKLFDEAGLDIILVGDSVGNVMLGYRNTLPVTMNEMLIHTQAVARGVKRALVVADMPFGSYQSDPKLAVSNAIDLAKAGAEAVKLEGVEYLDIIKKIIKAGIPVMGHIGFLPQSVNSKGARVQGLGTKEAKRLQQAAKALEKAGCFALVLELIDPLVAKKITKAIKIPTIGIGSGPNCTGQILVGYDMLGIYPDPPRFVKKYLNLAVEIKTAVKRFISSV